MASLPATRIFPLRQDLPSLGKAVAGSRRARRGGLRDSRSPCRGRRCGRSLATKAPPTIPGTSPPIPATTILPLRCRARSVMKAKLWWKLDLHQAVAAAEAVIPLPRRREPGHEGRRPSPRRRPATTTLPLAPTSRRTPRTALADPHPGDAPCSRSSGRATPFEPVAEDHCFTAASGPLGARDDDLAALRGLDVHVARPRHRSDLGRHHPVTAVEVRIGQTVGR